MPTESPIISKRLFDAINSYPEADSKTTTFFGVASGALAVVSAERLISSGVDIQVVLSAVGSLALGKLSQVRAKNAYKNGIRHAGQMIAEVNQVTQELDK